MNYFDSIIKIIPYIFYFTGLFIDQLEYSG